MPAPVVAVVDEFERRRGVPGEPCRDVPEAGALGDAGDDFVVVHTRFPIAARSLLVAATPTAFPVRSTPAGSDGEVIYVPRVDNVPMVEQGDRGVSTLVGAILLFGIILVVYATWQAAVVPAENKQVEFDAFQDAGEDVTELRNAMQRTAVTGVQTSTVVQTGTYYPSRVLFVNPPPATGTLATEPAGEVTLSNVAATDGDVRDYWNGDDRSFDTERIVFRTDYNELRTGSLGVDPSGATYLAAGATVMRDAQTLVSGNRITLVTVAGDYRDGGVTVAPAVEPVSVGTDTISVRNTSSNFTMTVPTRLEQDAWDEIADGQETITDVAVTDGNATLTFADGTYQLRLARVALREPTGPSVESAPDARYIAAPNREPVTVDREPVRLVAHTRDRYDNPRSDIEVTFDVVSGGSGSVQVADPNGGSCSAVDWNDVSGGSAVTVTSDGDGAAVACLKPESTGNGNGNGNGNGKGNGNSKTISVNATMDASGVGTAARTTNFTVTVV